MKKILSIFGVFFTFLLFAQTTDKQKVLADTQSFMQLYEKKDYDKILEMSHPKLLEKFDRQMLLSAFKTVFEGNDEFKISLDKVDNSAYKVSEIYQDNGSKYAFVSYPMSMKMTFLKQKLDTDTKKMMISMMEAKGMKASFTDDSTMSIKKSALVVALYDKSTGNQWKYTNHDDNNPMYTSIIPVNIIKKAQAYYSDLLLKEKENAN